MKQKYIFLISGKMRSGKNQFAEYLKNELEKNKTSVNVDLFAGTLKEWCSEDFQPLVDYLNDFSKNISQEIKNLGISTITSNIIEKIQELHTETENWYENKNQITRILLQTYGTKIFRNRIDSNCWVNQLIERILYSKKNITIITDVRFPNEISSLEYNILLKEFEIIKIRINRNIKINNGIPEHESETALDNYKNWDFEIINDGTLNDLKLSAIKLSKSFL